MPPKTSKLHFKTPDKPVTIFKEPILQVLTVSFSGSSLSHQFGSATGVKLPSVFSRYSLAAASAAQGAETTGAATLGTTAVMRDPRAVSVSQTRPQSIHQLRKLVSPSPQPKGYFHRRRETRYRCWRRILAPGRNRPDPIIIPSTYILNK